MGDKEQSRESLPTDSASPKTYHKKEKTKYQAFRSDDESSSDADEPDGNQALGRIRGRKKSQRSNTIKIKDKLKNMKGKKKEKEKEKDKEKDKDKDREKKRKIKKSEDESTLVQDQPMHEPVFGVSLDLAVKRSAFPDKIELPRVLRECIVYIEEKGLDSEGIYRVSGVKSKVENLKQLYNEGRKVDLNDYDPNTVASLLKLYLRELPSNVLTTRLAPIFDSCISMENSQEQLIHFQRLVNDLPCPNKTLLGWLFTHFSHIMERSAETKMNIQNLSIVFSPTMSISHGVLNIFFQNTQELFPNVELARYVPTEESDESAILPDTVQDLQNVLHENEKVLAQLHDRVNQGEEDEDLMEELWERQRKSTRIKRKIKTLRKEEKENSLNQVAIDDQQTKVSEADHSDQNKPETNLENENIKGETVVENRRSKAEEETVIEKPKKKPMKPPAPKMMTAWKAEIITSKQTTETKIEDDIQNENPPEKTESNIEEVQSDDEEMLLLLAEEQRLLIKNEELQKVVEKIQKKIQREKKEIEELNAKLREHQDTKDDSSSSASTSASSSRRSSISSSVNDDDSETEEDNTELEIMLQELEIENKKLKEESMKLVTQISHERQACVDTRTEIRLLQMKALTSSKGTTIIGNNTRHRYSTCSLVTVRKFELNFD